MADDDSLLVTVDGDSSGIFRTGGRPSRFHERSGEGILERFENLPGVILKFKQKSFGVGVPKDRLEEFGRQSSGYLGKLAEKRRVRAVPVKSMATSYMDNDIQGRLEKGQSKQKSRLKEISEKVSVCYDIMQEKLLKESSSFKLSSEFHRRAKKQWYRLCHMELSDKDLQRTFAGVRSSFDYLQMADLLETDIRKFVEKLLSMFYQAVNETDDLLADIKMKVKRQSSPLSNRSEDQKSNRDHRTKVTVPNYYMPTATVEPTRERQQIKVTDPEGKNRDERFVGKRTGGYLNSFDNFGSSKNRGHFSHSDIGLRKKLLDTKKVEEEELKKYHNEQSLVKVDLETRIEEKRIGAQIQKHLKGSLGDILNTRKQSNPVEPNRDTPHWADPIGSLQEGVSKKTYAPSHSGFGEYLENKSLAISSNQRYNTSNCLPHSESSSVNHRSQREVNQGLRDFLEEFKANTSQIIHHTHTAHR